MLVEIWNSEGVNMKQSSRRQARETAFCLIFEWSFHKEDLQSMLNNAMDGRGVEPDPFARELVEKTIAEVEKWDALIEQYSETWKISRLSRVTLAVLRLGFCEITRMEDIPLGATINEAVELCKKFATEEEAAYVNGILGRYGRELEPTEEKQQTSQSIPSPEQE